MAGKENPIKKGRLANIVVERLSARISSGELKSGQRLPTERALAESMGVSRTVIREAIRIMVDNNVLELWDGVSYVRQLSFDEIINNISRTVNPDAISTIEIMEVRAVLENYIVKKAVENITEKQIEKLQAGIDQMEQIMAEGGNGSTLENAFHHGLAEATNNSALKSIYVLCEDLLNITLHETWRVAKKIGAPNTAVADHQAILDAVRTRNKKQAEILMQAHMDYACKNLQKLCELEESEKALIGLADEIRQAK